MKRFLALFLTIVMLWVMVSCKPSQGTEPQATTPEVTTSEVTTPEETTPEEVTTPEETTPEETSPEGTTPAWQAGLTPDGKLKLTHVTITAGDSPAELTAVSELTAYLEKRSITVSEGGFPIDIYLDYSLDEDAYCVEAKFFGKYLGMDIRGGNGRGVLYGVYGFLEEYAGLRSYTPYLEVYPTEGDIII